MLEFPLTQGKVVLIDDQDRELLLPYKWYAAMFRKTWYAFASEAGESRPRNLYMHRLIMGMPEGLEVGHVDGDGLNNRRDNLRLATHMQNLTNQRVNAANTSGYRGVTWNKRRMQWMAQTKHFGKHIHFGYHDNLVDAAVAYDKGMRAIHGPHCHSNFPEEVSVAEGRLV